MTVKSKQNFTVNFLVRAKFLIGPRRQNNSKHYKNPDSIGNA